MCISVYRKRKHKAQDAPLLVNNLKIKEIEEQDQYKYFSINESVGILGPLNKERVIKEYKSRVKKIWNSELNGLNNSRAHNAFAVPVIAPTITILDWTKKEICDLDVMTRKILTTAGAFHVASDVDRLYVQRSQGGRELRSIEDLYEIKTVRKAEHLQSMTGKHRLLTLVREHEKKNFADLEEHSKT